MYNNYYSLCDVQRSLVLCCFPSYRSCTATYWRQLEKFCACTVYTRRTFSDVTRAFSCHVFHECVNISAAVGTKIIGGTQLEFIYLFIFFKETLLSRKEIHGRKFPTLARFAMERVENVRSTSCGDIVGVILSLTRRRELREVREVSIFLHSRTIEWDVSSRGIYRCY